MTIKRVSLNCYFNGFWCHCLTTHLNTYIITREEQNKSAKSHHPRVNVISRGGVVAPQSSCCDASASETGGWSGLREMNLL